MASETRDAIVRWAKWGVANEVRIHYSQARPMPIKVAPGTLPLRTDCSGFATLVYKWSGAPDPNGLHYNGQGYTGTILRHMRRIPRAMALPGDLLVFGDWPGHHVVIFVEPGSKLDPLVVSHGQERGPMLIRLSQEQRFQPHPAQCLSNLPAHDPPPLHRVPTFGAGGTRRVL